MKNKLPHGLAGGMFIREVMQYNSDAGFSYRELLKDNFSKGDYEFYDAFDLLKSELSVPKLRDLGYLPEEKEELIPQIMGALAGSFEGNPIRFDESGLNWVLDMHLLGGNV